MNMRDTTTANVCRSFDQFMENSWYNQNLEYKGTRFYLRKKNRTLQSASGPVYLPCIDIANVLVDLPLRGKGVFTAVLAHIEKYCRTHGMALYIENVLEPFLAAALRRHDWFFTIAGDGVHSYYRIYGEKTYERIAKDHQSSNGRRDSAVCG